MSEPIRIKRPDAVRAAYLMRQLIGRFQARMIEHADGRWEIVVVAGREPTALLSGLLGVVQRCLDDGDANYATICFQDRACTIGSRPRSGNAHGLNAEHEADHRGTQTRHPSLSARHA